MARQQSIYARAARRAALAVPKLPHSKGRDISHADDARFSCPYCGKKLKSENGRYHHVVLRPSCRARHLKEVSKKRERERALPLETAGDEPPTKQARTDEEGPPIAGPSRLPIPRPSAANSPIEGEDSEPGDGRSRNGLFTEQFPISTAGAPIGTRHMKQRDLRKYMEACGRLGDRELFETAEIMMGTGLSGRGRSRHLKGPAYKKWKGKGKEVWNNNAALLSDIDKLPTGPIWKTAQVLAGRGLYERSHTLYFRDICEVIRELIGARRFKDCMRYAPERHWTSWDQKCRVYDEAWSGDWWWRMQYLIHNRNGTVVPLIIARDETILANNLRGKKAHPVYLSIGNISKVTQRKPTKRAMILVGYVPVNRFKDVLDKKTRRYFRGDLLHRSLEVIFEPLKTASVDGMLARCADGYLRHIYPIISAWIADWPKQNDLAGTTQSGCPKCCHKWKGRGQGGPSVPLCDPGETLAAIQEYLQNWRPGVLKRHLVTPWVPFWANIPHVDIGRALAPDLLHQLYKGMFEHAKDWVEDLLGTDEFNRRFKEMPPAQDLRNVDFLALGDVPVYAIKPLDYR